MSIQVIKKNQQAAGQFNGGEILENKPIGFPREGGHLRPYSNLFYWLSVRLFSVSVVPKLVKFKNLTEILLRLCCFLLPVAGAGLGQGYLFSEGSLTAYAMEGLSISRNGCFCNAKSP